MYVLGFLVFAGMMAGRFICGWLCSFGLLQELLHKIPGKKIKVPEKINAIFKRGKHLVLLIFVIVLPIYSANQFGISVLYFCKYICPVGMLEGGIPLVVLNESLQSPIGYLFKWKMAILILVIAAAVLIFRPFCKYFCPLGAFYSIFNPISLYHYEVDVSKCIRCGSCLNSCSAQAIHGSWRSKKYKEISEVE